jgi:hypothetical protein
MLKKCKIEKNVACDWSHPRWKRTRDRFRPFGPT